MRSRSSSRGSWGQRHALERLREQRFVGTAKKALGGGRAVGATDVIVVHGGERRELAVAQAIAALVMQGQLSVTARHPGTAALEAIGAVAGHLFQARSLGARQGLERMVAVTQRFEQLAAQRAQSVRRGSARVLRAATRSRYRAGISCSTRARSSSGGSARASTCNGRVAKKKVRVASSWVVRRCALARRSRARVGSSAAWAIRPSRAQTPLKRCATCSTGCVCPRSGHTGDIGCPAPAPVRVLRSDAPAPGCARLRPAPPRSRRPGGGRRTRVGDRGDEATGSRPPAGPPARPPKPAERPPPSRRPAGPGGPGIGWWPSKPHAGHGWKRSGE